MSNNLSFREVVGEQDWNGFLLKLSPNTFLQSWQWGQVQQATGEQVRYVGIFEGDMQIGAALTITVNARRGKFLFVPHGPLFLNDEQAREHLPAVVQHLKKLASDDKAVALRLAPLLLTTPDNQEALRDLRFHPAPLHVHTELTWNLDITGSIETLLAGMRKTSRHAVKKAQQAGITVEITTDPSAVNRFWPLYDSTRHRHQFVPFSKSFLEAQIKAFSPDAIYFVFASHAGQDLAAGIFIQFGNTVFYHHGASQKMNSQLPASHALQWAAIQEAKRRGATRYNFWGIAPEEQPKHPFAGITVFKKGFGGYAMDYMHAQDLPLNWHYATLWLVDTYRKYKRGF